MGHKKRLGKGLDSLISSPEEEEAGAGVQEIPLHKIELNPKQPREEVDEEKLKNLAESIESSGVIQPIVVRPRDDMYQLAVGERRLRASRRAGLETIPAVVRDLSDEDMLETALAENIQRSDLNPVEKARAVQRMIDELEITQAEAGERLGLNRSTVSNLLRLLELQPELREMVSRETLSEGHARALLGLEDEDTRLEAAKRVVAEGLSVRKTEELVSRLNREPDEDAEPTPSKPKTSSRSPQLERLEDELQRSLGTRVKINAGKKKGRIVVHYENPDEFNRIYELLVKGYEEEQKRPMTA